MVLELRLGSRRARRVKEEDEDEEGEKESERTPRRRVVGIRFFRVSSG